MQSFIGFFFLSTSGLMWVVLFLRCEVALPVFYDVGLWVFGLVWGFCVFMRCWFAYFLIFFNESANLNDNTNIHVSLDLRLLYFLITIWVFATLSISVNFQSAKPYV